MNIRKYFEPKNSEPGILTGTDGDKTIRKKITAQEDRNEEELSSEEVKKMKKKIEELSDKKKTFSVFPPVVNSDVVRKISAFNQKANEVKCVIGSGFCSGHNVKLTRCVEMKRVSVVEDNGKLTWQMREVAILACPAASLSVEKSGVTSAVGIELPEYGTTNGKKKKFACNVSDQPQPIVREKNGKQGLLLDNTD